jgi:ABC-type phosphate transport system substrate-binding protein
MFEINKEELAKKQAEHEMRKMLAKMMSEAILNSDAPESRKLNIRVLNKAEDTIDAIHETIEKYVKPDNQANAETLKTVLEYLSLVEVGIKQFADSTPFVKETEEE